MCRCNNVNIGDYTNQVSVLVPYFMRNLSTDCYEIRDAVCIDRCLVDEIKYLWKCGIITVGCCCGHNKEKPYIQVIDEHQWIMRKLGYFENNFSPVTFSPKS